MNEKVKGNTWGKYDRAANNSHPIPIVDKAELNEIEERIAAHFEKQNKSEDQLFKEIMVLAEKEKDKIAFLENEIAKYLSGINGQTFVVSGICSTQIQGPLFLDRRLRIEIDKIKRLQSLEERTVTKKPQTPRAPIEKVDPLSLIRPIWIDEFHRIEAILKDKVTRWKGEGHGAKAECAAFCDYLFYANFFKTGRKDRVKVCKKFAYNRYDEIDITIQLEKDSKTIRKPNIAKIISILKQG